MTTRESDHGKKLGITRPRPDGGVKRNGITRPRPDGEVKSESASFAFRKRLETKSRF